VQREAPPASYSVRPQLGRSADRGKFLALALAVARARLHRPVTPLYDAAMRVLLQRVSEASVTVDGRTTGAIDRGLLVLAAVGHDDTADDRSWLARKIVQLRVFDDAAGVMNRSVLDIGGAVLAVSQFTLHASARKGNRPSYAAAAPPDVARPAFDAFVAELSALLGRPVPTGIFGATMRVALVNDGPVTIWLDSKARE
jgi:D-aminoacyl-tRNA deacylase